MNASFFLSLLIFGIISGIPANLLAVEPEKTEGSAEAENGLWIERKNKCFLKLDIEENRLRIHFFDRDKHPEKSDALRVIAHYTPRNVTSRQTVLFKPVDDEEYLEAERFIRPPFNFNVIVVLVFDEAGERTESYAGRILPKHEVRDQVQGN